MLVHRGSSLTATGGFLNRAKKILFILPKWPEHTLWGHFVYKFPALGLLTIAASTPAHYEIGFIDENMQAIDFDCDADIIALSLMTPLALQSYSIADRFKEKGKTVILGGIHASIFPDEALQHADAVVIGEGESSWPELLSDFENGTLKAKYRQSGFSDLKDLPFARRDLLQHGSYITRSTIQLTRGCPYNCEYCSVTAFSGRKFRFRPMEQFIKEYRSLQDRFVFIVDDNIMSNRKVALELFEQLRGSKKWWGSQVPITVADDEEVLKAMAECGCKTLFIGFESLEQDNLQQMGKQFVKASKHMDRIKRIQDYGIGIQGSFIVGCDHDTAATFDNLYEFIMRSKLNAFLISVLTPFPGTLLADRLEKEGRVLTKNWSLYDMGTVVFQPKNFSPEELQSRYDELNRSLYSIRSILKRTVKPNTNMIIFVPQNFGFRKAWRKQLSHRLNTSDYLHTSDCSAAL